MSKATALKTPTQNHILFWIGAAVFAGLFVWLFDEVLLPFILGAAIAYFLDPVVEFMARHKIPRTPAILLILGGFFIIVCGLLAVTAPLALHEAQQLIAAIPGYLDKANAMIAPHTAWLQERIHNGDIESFKQALQSNIGNAIKTGGGIIAGLASGGKAFAGFLATLVLTPITAFFMLKEWPQMTAWIDDLLPRKNQETIKALLNDINKKIAGFVRGQLSVAFILALAYALALTFAGLDYGFIIGLIAGFLSIIPLAGATIGMIIAVAVAWFQSGTLNYVAMIAIIFLAGQLIEGNVLTPRILGKSVGMHPLWILFALMAGASFGGMAGMLIAVPFAAAAGVLVSFALAQYKDSAFYKGKK